MGLRIRFTLIIRVTVKGLEFRGLGFRACGLGFRGCFDFTYVEHAVDYLQGNVEGTAACEVLAWPDCGKLSDTFTQPTSPAAAKPPEPTPFEI